MKARATITLPDILLEEIDGMCGAKKSRSSFIEQALREYLKRSKKKAGKHSRLKSVKRDTQLRNRRAGDVLTYRVMI